MSQVHGVRGGVAACLCILAVVLPPVTAAPAAAARSIAFVDFAVRAADAQAQGSAWLGPAIPELLQAKLQLFAGARVLERMRVRALLREARADAGLAGDDPAALAAFIPAEVLIAGSVSVDPKDPRRIRVQARAFEVETSKIVSEAAFSGTGDLAGLLRIAEDLAQTLADGMNLPYTPDQLVYAEPARLDTLRFLLEGENHLAAGRFREAIAALQRALDGNEGRYFAAAHRLQGEVYQALAKSSSGEQERAVRDEYIKKFKEDALAASGALYDLGLAYEANRMWKEAGAAYEDYLRAVGGAGETVRWVFTPAGEVPGRRPRPGEFQTEVGQPVIADGSRLHTVAHRFRVVPDRVGFTAKDETWTLVTLDAADGRIVAQVPLEPILGEPVVPGAERRPLLAGAEQGRVFILWEYTLEIGRISRRQNGLPTLAAIGRDGQVIWRRELGPETVGVPGGGCAVHRGRLYFHLVEQDASRAAHSLLAVDGATGRTLAQVRLSERDVAFLQQKPLRGLDLAAGTLTAADGIYDLSTGALSPHTEVAPASRAAEPVPLSRRVGMPTGYPGVTWLRDWPDAKLFRGGQKIMDLPGCEVALEAPPRPVSGSLVCRREDGFLLVDPERRAAIAIKARQGTPLRVEANDGATLALAYEYYPETQSPDPQFGLPGEGRATVLNFFDAATGQLLAKHRASGLPLLLGRDFLMRQGSQIMRLGIVPHATVPVVPSPEAHLRAATCLLELDELPAAADHLARFETANPGDPRGQFLRMRLAGLAGKTVEAARLALRVVMAGGLDAERLGACLRHLQQALPEVREALQAPVGGRVQFWSSPAPGELVCTGEDRGGGYRHVILDVSGRSFQLAPPFAPRRAKGDLWTIQRYAGVRVYGMSEEESSARTRPAMLDLLSGERVLGRPGTDPSGGFLESIPAAFIVEKDREATVVVLDPDSLDVVERIAVASSIEAYSAEDVTVFVAGGKFVAAGEARATVVDRRRRTRIGDVAIQLKNEILFGVAADSSTLYAAVGGADFEAYLYGGRAGWMRVEARPLTAGGAGWSFVADGQMAGGPVIEGDAIVFPCHEGRLPQPAIVEAGGKEFYQAISDAPLALKKIRLDRRTGARLGEEPLAAETMSRPLPGPLIAPLLNGAKSLVSFDDSRSLFNPEPPRRLFPGRRESVYETIPRHREFMFPGEGAKPLEVRTELGGGDIRVLQKVGEAATLAAGGGVVLESVGGGVILVKDSVTAESLMPASERLGVKR